MKLLASLLPLFLLGSVGFGTGCTGTIIDGYEQGVPGDENDPLTPEEEEEQQAICVGDGEPGGACEVTDDCNAPMVCSGGVCIGPRDPSYTCDPIEGIDCLAEGETCVNGLCIAAPGACQFLEDCPLGYTCNAGQCTPERDGSACSDPGPGPALAGVWDANSVLHLRDGLPGVVDGILDASEIARDIIQGDLDLGLPGLVETLLGGIVASIVQSYVPPYALDIVTNLATMSDVLDTMNIEGTLELDGQACDGNYRGRHIWNFVTFDLNGVAVRVTPDELPGVSTVENDDFSARYHCGDLLIDRHRINNVMTQLVRWALDTAVQIVSPHNTVEEALGALINCNNVGNEIQNTCQNLGGGFICGGVGAGAAGACNAFKQTGIAAIGQAIDDAAVKMSLIKLSGIIPINEDGTMQQGTWYGSLVGGDFRGEIVAERQ